MLYIAMYIYVYIFLFFLSLQIYSPCQLFCADEAETKYFVRLKISEHGLVILYNERMQVFGVNMYIKDIYHVSCIKEVRV